MENFDPEAVIPSEAESKIYLKDLPPSGCSSVFPFIRKSRFRNAIAIIYNLLSYLFQIEILWFIAMNESNVFLVTSHSLLLVTLSVEIFLLVAIGPWAAEPQYIITEFLLLLPACIFLYFGLDLTVTPYLNYLLLGTGVIVFSAMFFSFILSMEMFRIHSKYYKQTLEPVKWYHYVLNSFTVASNVVCLRKELDREKASLMAFIHYLVIANDSLLKFENEIPTKKFSFCYWFQKDYFQKLNKTLKAIKVINYSQHFHEEELLNDIGAPYLCKKDDQNQEAEAREPTRENVSTPRVRTPMLPIDRSSKTSSKTSSKGLSSTSLQVGSSRSIISTKSSRSTKSTSDTLATRL